MAHLGRFPRFETKAEYDAAVASMWRRSPKAGSQSRGTMTPIAHTSMLERMGASDLGPDLPEAKNINLSEIGFDEEGDTNMANDTHPAEPETEPADTTSGAGDVPNADAEAWLSGAGVHHPDQAIMPDTPMTNEGPTTPAGPPRAADDDDESQSEEKGEDGLQSGEEEVTLDAEQQRLRDRTITKPLQAWWTCSIRLKLLATLRRS